MLQNKEWFISPVNILHHLEIGPACVDLWNDPRLKFVHQLAEDDTVLERILKGLSDRELLSQD